jgi:hypothetical protein
MGGRTFDQFMSRQRAKAKEGRGSQDASPARRENEQEKLPGRQPAVTTK